VMAGGRLYWTRNANADAVVLVPAAGGEARTLMPGAILPSWSPDGQRIAFTDAGAGLVDGALSNDAAVVELDEWRRVVSVPRPIVAGFHEDFTPRWSPDASWIAYHSHRSARPVVYYAGDGTTDDIYLRRPWAPMSEEIRLTDFGWEAGPPDWSPDGRRLVFDSWERGGPPGIARPWIVTIDPADGQRIGVERLRLPEGVDNAAMSTWSPDGREIALTALRGGQRYELWVVRADGSGGERLLDFRSKTHGGVHWTPDGRYLVYAALSDHQMQLFRIGRVGGEPEQLTRDAANLLHPRVSPDGRWIAASRIVRVKEVWRMEIR
jgi:Tol biopolymer transport system component